MRILILSCNTGGGHNAAGRAVKEIFEKNGDEAVMLDYLCLAGNKVSKTVGNVYIETVKNVPGLFGAVYKLGMGVSRICHRSPVYYVNSVMGKIYKTISQRKSCRCSYYASSVSGGDDNLHEKTWYEASTYNSCDDRLYMYSVLGRD